MEGSKSPGASRGDKERQSATITEFVRSHLTVLETSKTAGKRLEKECP